MAVRISQRSRRSSVSRARLTLTRTTGTAAPIRTRITVMTMISSSRVTPLDRRAENIPGLPIFILIPDSRATANASEPKVTGTLVHRDHGLRALHRERLVLAIARARGADRKSSRALGFGHEHQVENRAIAGNAGHVRRPLQADSHSSAGGIVAQDGRSYGLAILAEKIALGCIYEL